MPMLRNIDSRFSQAPMDLDIPRSRWNRDSDHKTTFNAGDLVPIFCDEVLPGDTFDMKLSHVCRMSTPIFPVMDNAYLETFFFFVPARLVWDHWKEFNGENNTSYWTQPVEYTVPQIALDPGTFDSADGDAVGGAVRGSVADYLGVPTRVYSNNIDSITQMGDLRVSALPFRAYVKVWNDWFRDQNVMQPAHLSTDDNDRSIVGTYDSDGNAIEARIGAELGGALLKVSKYHDYFTSALPAPQKGPDVRINGDVKPGYFDASMPPGFAPVVTNSLVQTPDVMSNVGLRFKTSNPFMETGNNYDLKINSQTSTLGTLVGDQSSGAIDESNNNLIPSNLYANMLGSSVSLLVNDVRLAFQLQKLYEKDARGGTRYIEVIKSHFGVDSPDARLQRSEYLGGSRQPINVSQVIQTSSTDQTSPLGSTAAYSLTNGTSDSFIKSFTEHGFIIGVACVRTDHTYQQGINKMWSRRRRFDYYWPALANIGEQPILKKEILAGGRYDDEAFGYQEAWAEYRYKPSIVSGAFRSNVNGSLDSWHYADYFDPSYDATMVVDESFIQETSKNVDRTLAVQSSLEDQFIADFYFQCNTTRVMPLYSVPGLVDHH